MHLSVFSPAILFSTVSQLSRLACVRDVEKSRGRTVVVPLMLIWLLSACSLPIPLIDPVSRTQITPAQNCAIGYDLARLIHQNISLRETVIIAPRRGNPCETRALHYLRLSGFAVDDTGRSAGSRNTQPGFDVTLTSRQDGTIEAVATVAGTLHIARRYRLAETGVYPVSAASIGALSAPYQRRVRHPDPYVAFPSEERVR